MLVTPQSAKFLLMLLLVPVGAVVLLANGFVAEAWQDKRRDDQIRSIEEKARQDPALNKLVEKSRQSPLSAGERAGRMRKKLLRDAP